MRGGWEVELVQVERRCSSAQLGPSTGSQPALCLWYVVVEGGGGPPRREARPGQSALRRALGLAGLSPVRPRPGESYALRGGHPHTHSRLLGKGLPMARTCAPSCRVLVIAITPCTRTHTCIHYLVSVRDRVCRFIAPKALLSLSPVHSARRDGIISPSQGLLSPDASLDSSVSISAVAAGSSIFVRQEKLPLPRTLFSERGKKLSPAPRQVRPGKAIEQQLVYPFAARGGKGVPRIVQ